MKNENKNLIYARQGLSEIEQRYPMGLITHTDHYWKLLFLGHPLKLWNKAEKLQEETVYVQFDENNRDTFHYIVLSPDGSPQKGSIEFDQVIRERIPEKRVTIEELNKFQIKRRILGITAERKHTRFFVDPGLLNHQIGLLCALKALTEKKIDLMKKILIGSRANSVIYPDTYLVWRENLLKNPALEAEEPLELFQSQLQGSDSYELALLAYKEIKKLILEANDLKTTVEIAQIKHQNKPAYYLVVIGRVPGDPADIITWGRATCILDPGLNQTYSILEFQNKKSKKQEITLQEYSMSMKLEITWKERTVCYLEGEIRILDKYNAHHDKISSMELFVKDSDWFQRIKTPLLSDEVLLKHPVQTIIKPHGAHSRLPPLRDKDTPTIKKVPSQTQATTMNKKLTRPKPSLPDIHIHKKTQQTLINGLFSPPNTKITAPESKIQIKKYLSGSLFCPPDAKIIQPQAPLALKKESMKSQSRSLIKKEEPNRSMVLKIK